MTTIEHLKAARALIEKGWTQGAFAVNASGQPCKESDDAACKWCIIGAISRSVGLRSLIVIASVTRPLEAAAGVDNIGCWNDDPTRTQSDVLALFDKAIEMEERKV